MRSNRREKDGKDQSQFTPSSREAREPKTIPFAERLTCTINEAREATGLGRTKLYELIGAGHLATTTVGRRRLVVVRSLLSLLETNRST
jgi:excisionase family DNA binding protein